MKTKFALSLEDAKRIAAAAEAEALRNQWNVAISILDDGGTPVYFQRMDGTQIASAEIAGAKARAAIGFKRPTKMLEDTVAAGRVAMLALPGIVPVEGGLPLVHKGEIVGAIGVSGVQSFQDGIIAKAGADLLLAE